MSIETVIKIEREIMQIEKDRAKAEAANDAAIELEENRRCARSSRESR